MAPTKTKSKKPSAASKRSAPLKLATSAPAVATGVSENKEQTKPAAAAAEKAAPAAKPAVAKKSAAPAPARRPAETSRVASRAASENVVDFSSRGFRDAFDRTASEAQRMQEQATRFSRESAQQMSRGASVASRAMNEGVAIMQGNVETCMQCGNIAADMTRKLSEEVFTFANDMFSSNVEISKDLFACRTINDVFDLQNRLMRTNLDNFFSESARLSEMVFDYINQAAEPIGERINETTDRLSRSIAA
jgi:hypothetical protein